ncbi:uncharacterized protein EV420DRAFT_1482300 [Desarmillaria tabescens]|uniref:Uncharacterized protein n=1 Tax=Armillaria tabescens TaxID=1929756 RepID=A0AA39MZM8_ARMTA|nr:uncharacterized protein EV420DRAFT_1482300 [Desarmillaria tabescens]KAK0451954.1 hypothetical protein EV420DRAFT_1482300 [Desarmillaria tabescens]
MVSRTESQPDSRPVHPEANMGLDLASCTTLGPALASDSSLTEELPPPTSLPGGEVVAAVLHVHMVLQNPQPTLFLLQSDMIFQAPPDVQQPVQQPVQQTIFLSQSEVLFRNK